VGDDIPATENFVANSEHRGSHSSRNRSGSYLSSAASPPNVGFSTAPGQQQQTVFPAPSPRPGAMRDTFPGSSLDPSGNYTTAGLPRPGYPPAQNYRYSPRNNSDNTTHGSFGYQPPPPPAQYGNDVGGTRDGRYYTPKDYFGPGNSNSFSPTGREGPPGTLGATTAPHEPRVWSAPTAGGQGYTTNQYAGYGRDLPPPLPRQGPTIETDLSPDEASY